MSDEAIEEIKEMVAEHGQLVYEYEGAFYLAAPVEPAAPVLEGK